MSDRMITGSIKPAVSAAGGKIVRLVVAATVTVLVLSGLVTGFVFGTAELGRRLRLAGGSMDDRPVAVTIAGRQYTIPGNAIRFQSQRSGGALSELDLYLSWPNLAGLTESTRGLFHSPASPDLIFLSLSAFDDKTETGPRSDEYELPGPAAVAGLRRVQRVGGPTSAGELVYVSQGGRPAGYRVSCLERAATGIIVADCIRQTSLSPGLQLTYRFSQSLLPQWREIDSGLAEWIDRHAVR